MKVLVVEDDKVMSVAIERKLKSKGFEVLTASNGIEGLSLVQIDNPDIIVSDIIMPGISGFELFNVIRQIDLKKTPLIFISSMKRKTVLQNFSDLKATNYFEKPLNLNKLCQKIQQLLNP